MDSSLTPVFVPRDGKHKHNFHAHEQISPATALTKMVFNFLSFSV